jgi:ERCC4-type nuclease
METITDNNLPQDGWNIVLLVDTQELMRDKTCREDEFLDRLSERITCERCSLPAGDYLWVARSGSHEVVLNWVVESKRHPKFCSSIVKTSKILPPLKRMHVQHLKLRFSQVCNRELLIERGYDYWKIWQCSYVYAMSNAYLKNSSKKTLPWLYGIPKMSKRQLII